MSDVQNTTVPAAAVPEADVTPAVATATDAVAPAVETKDVADAPPKPEVTEAVAAEETKAAEPATAAETSAEKTVEPITEGLLAWKGPGLVKSLIPSKKNFWLSDEPVAAENLDLYLRGEKPEIAHPVVAWAAQSGKGLLFANKKNDTDRTHPADVFALYDATDLKKQSPHEISFKLNGHNHTFKATSDAERDGWYLSIEKAIELSKASKEEIHESEGYKAELEKLNKPATVVAAAKRSQSQPKKSLDADKAVAERAGSSSGEDEAEKKKKSRSTSRGMFNRLKGKKEEAEQKAVEKKEEKEAEKEEKKTEEAAPVAESTEAAPVAAAVAAAEIPAAAEAAEATEAKPVEETAATEEKPSKASKRGSIFGRVQSTWSGMRSPAKEKEQKDAELKPETPAKDAPVSENPPVLPETATTEPVTEPAVPAVEEPEAKADAPKEEVASPSKEKTNFLSGLGFMKRGRSVSPSTNLKDAPKKEETPATEEAATEPVAKVEEPAAEAGAEAEKPTEKVEEPKTETTTTNKRQSMLGSLGRRASKALNRMQAPKKEAPAAASASKEEETAEVKPAEETPVAAGEAKPEESGEQKTIGDVVPDAVNVGQPQPQQSTPAVAASA